MATRRANDGNFYTMQEFQRFYGDAQGLNMWENAGAQEPGAAAGAQEPGVAAPGPGAPQAAATPSPATDAPAGAAEPGRDAIVQVLFRPADMDFFRAEGARYGSGALHNAARRELAYWIRNRHTVGDTDPDVHEVRFPWQLYVAMHKRSHDLVGPGIQTFEATFMAGTTDPNRSGQPRLDFVIRHTDGGYWRIHPGAKATQDAVPRYFEPEMVRTRFASEQWRHLHPQGFTFEDALVMPQTDRKGRKETWAVLENLPLGELDSSPDATFKWWLWIANLGRHTRRVIGAGVVGAELTFANAGTKKVVCRRTDGSAVEIEFSRSEIISIAPR